MATTIEAPLVGRDVPAGTLSYEEYLDWLDSETHAEWVDGTVMLMSPVERVNNNVCGFLLRIISTWVEAKGLGEVAFEPFQMRTGPDLNGRSPDILFVAQANLNRLKRTWLDGPADVVVEVVSAGSRVVDRGAKFHEYEQGGVREYWLIDPIRNQAEFYEPDESGYYRLMAVEDGVFRSNVIEGFTMRVDWLWQRPLPSLIDVLAGWGLVSKRNQ